MKIEAAQQILTQKEPPGLYDVVEPALASLELRDVLVEGSFDKNETIRYNCVRVLFRALSREPQLFYQYWDRFAGMIGSPNGFHRSVAAQAIAYLTPVDADCRLDRVLRKYLALIDDDKVMVTHYFVETLDLVYRARPDLQAKIVKTLLSIDKTRHTPSRRDLLKADILAFFDRLYAVLPAGDQKRARGFAEVALTGISTKTRKAAKSFAAQHPA